VIADEGSWFLHRGPMCNIVSVIEPGLREPIQRIAEVSRTLKASGRLLLKTPAHDLRVLQRNG
jgi:hypothetical protein